MSDLALPNNKQTKIKTNNSEKMNKNRYASRFMSLTIIVAF